MSKKKFSQPTTSLLVAVGIVTFVLIATVTIVIGYIWHTLEVSRIEHEREMQEYQEKLANKKRTPTVVAILPTEIMETVDTNELVNKPTTNPNDLLPYEEPTEKPVKKPTKKISNANTSKVKKKYNIEVYGMKNENPNNPVLLGVVGLDRCFLNPIKGSDFMSIERFGSELPGADRSYRNGTHHGTDFYPSDCGVVICYGTEVLAVEDGIIVRIDHDNTYRKYGTAERNQYLAKTANLPHDGVEYMSLFDLAKGRQIIIDHGNGLYSNYCHLSAVNPDIFVGDSLYRGDVIGYVGNSGTSKEAEDNDVGYIIGKDTYCANPGEYVDEMCKREWHLHLEMHYTEDEIDWENNPWYLSGDNTFLNWESVKKIFGYK